MVATVGLSLAVLPLAALAWSDGWSGTLTQMGWFFTKAALLTFGGAYAVLPYVYQGAVETYAWLTPSQMIDGLALGETTPGPLGEATHGDLKFTAPLTTITAAVVGVILNLAMFFAYHVLWPNGIGGRFDWISMLIGIAAGFALFRFKVGVIPVIGACALAGLAVTHIA
jgi:chromate transporter